MHQPDDGSPAIFWRGVQGHAGELFQINLNLLAHAVGDVPRAPQGGGLVRALDYRYGGAGETFPIQPFVFIGASGTLRSLPIGPNLRGFLDDPLGGEPLALSLPFRDSDLRLGNKGGGYFRRNDDDSAFHGGTDFNKAGEQFDIRAARDGTVHSFQTDRIILTHQTASGRTFRTLYLHVDLGTFELDAGDAVRRGQFLARTDPSLAGNTHLHFGVAVQGPPVMSSAPAIVGGGLARPSEVVPALWYFIDPWGVYNYYEHTDTSYETYLAPSGSGVKVFDSQIKGAEHTVHWATEPVSRTIPSLTSPYKNIERVQVRVRRGDNTDGSFPGEYEQFLVWLEGDSDFFLVPLAQASDRVMEVELVRLLREAFLHKKRVRLEYRYIEQLRFVTAAWLRH